MSSPSDLTDSALHVGRTGIVGIRSDQGDGGIANHPFHHHHHPNADAGMDPQNDSNNNTVMNDPRHTAHDGHNGTLQHPPPQHDPNGQSFSPSLFGGNSHPPQPPRQEQQQQQHFHLERHPVQPQMLPQEHQHRPMDAAADHHEEQQEYQQQFQETHDDSDMEGVGGDDILSRPSKKPRRRYDNNFKAEVLQHLKIPGVKLPGVAKKFSIPENTLREWTKVSAVRAIETARAKNSGQLKANMYDPLHRLASALKIFFEDNERQPQHLKQPVTTKLIVAKGLEAKTNLLELHRVQPMLEPKEKKALENFTGSDSWAKKFAKRHQLKMTGARIKELSEDEVREYHSSLIQISARIKQAGPAFEDVATVLRRAGEKLLRARGSTSAHFASGVYKSHNRHSSEPVSVMIPPTNTQNSTTNSVNYTSTLTQPAANYNPAHVQAEQVVQQHYHQQHTLQEHHQTHQQNEDGMWQHQHQSHTHEPTPNPVLDMQQQQDGQQQPQHFDRNTMNNVQLQ